MFTFHRMHYIPVDATLHPWLFRLSTVGAFGVPMFFLLSSFLITELLCREREQTGTIRVGAFYLRRIFRLWPLYFVVLAGLVLVNRFLPGFAPTTPGVWLAFTLFAGNWYVSRYGWISEPLNPLWSLSVEEQFYLVIPLMALAAGRRIMAYVCVGLTAISYVVIAWYSRRWWISHNDEWTNSFVHFQFFAAGMLLAMWLHGRLPRWRWTVRVAAGAAGLGAWLIAFAVFGVQSWHPHARPMNSLAGWWLMLVGCALMFLSVLGVPERVVPGWLAHLGRISYGLYLFHAPMMEMVFRHWGAGLDRLSAAMHLSGWRNGVGTVLAFGCSVVLADVSYRMIEMPFLRLKKRLEFVPTAD